jgi:protein gp37
MPTRIEYVDETINPLGHWCFGPGGTKDNPKPCPYCYARIMARRGMTKCEKCRTFDTPHTHFEQLEKLAKWKTPKNIFVQSMGDLFHDEVPSEWIGEVFKACFKAQQHTYLFLTKNPKRYNNVLNLMPDVEEPPLVYLGATATNNEQLKEAYNNPASWVSIEPLSEELDKKCFSFFMQNKQEVGRWEWVVLGSETGNRKDKVVPKREWIEAIVNECRRTNTPVFMKDSLRDIWGEPLIREYPWS